MRFRLGLYSGLLWFLFLWLGAAFWVADLLGIRRTSFMWLYTLSHGIAMFKVGSRLEKKLTRTDPQTGLPLELKLTPFRIVVLATMAILWTTEYVVLLRYFPSYVTGNEVPGGPFTVLCVPLLVVATIVEAVWTRRIDR